MPVYTDFNLKELAAFLFIAFGTVLIFYDMSAIVRGVKERKSKTAGELVVKSIRVFTTIAGITLLTCAGIYRNDTLLLFGLVLGLEELYETSLVLYVLKHGQ